MEAVLEQWFAAKYHLPPSHSMFQNRSLAEHLEEFMRDKLDDREDLAAQLNSPHLEAIDRSKIMEKITAIDAFLGSSEPATSGDPLADLWEQQIEAGEMPDFDLRPEDLKRG